WLIICPTASSSTFFDPLIYFRCSFSFRHKNTPLDNHIQRGETSQLFYKHRDFVLNIASFLQTSRLYFKPTAGQSDGHRHGDGSLRPAGTATVRAVLEKNDEERRNCVHVGRADHSCHLADCRTPIRSAPDFYRTACVHTDTARCDINHT